LNRTATAASDVVLLIPAYKPDHRLPILVDELIERGFAHIVVVDDGGGAEYRGIFDALEDRCDVVRHAVNLGKGRALKSGFNHCLNVFPDRAGVVTLDADGQHAPDDVAAVAERLVEGGERMVLGNRTFEGDVPLRSRFGNELTRLIFRFMVGMSLTDTQSGLRGIPMSQVHRLIPLAGERYEYETSMLLELHRHRVKLVEQPIRTIYIDDNRGSHFNPILDSFAIYFVLLRFVFSSVASALLDTVLFYLVFRMGVGVGGSVVIARAVSSLFNFSLNKRFVFRSSRPVPVSVLLYYALVGVVALLSYGSIRLLHDGVGMPILAAKILSDTLLFALSFFVQRDLIFKRPDVEED